MVCDLLALLKVFHRSHAGCELHVVETALFEYIRIPFPTTVP